ncbi:hypothetical protein COLO4_08181 [Corchorus olitorius]|uniref:Uncharacterized protein n=1 Tax=Corchorus olitorius TaxID=93759 RepID=A0A1R3KGW4_9ROSI|nr:hypothetical protein COLO4_08181 [Corchorus olitorius]
MEPKLRKKITRWYWRKKRENEGKPRGLKQKIGTRVYVFCLGISLKVKNGKGKT